jgi:magnesium-transporting ATPase (P-type)
MVKENLSFKPVTLGVGIASSDIPFTLETHIGVGIEGATRNQITDSSEFRLQRFGDLRHLLFRHGRYNYNRMAKAVLLFMYKNMALITLQFCYMFISDYSGTSLFDGGLLVGFNLVFTTLPVIAVGVWDEDLPPEGVTNFSQTYYHGIFELKFSWKHAVRFYLSGAFHGFLIFFFMAGGLWDVVINDDGHTEDWTVLCGVTYFTLVLTVISFTGHTT